MVTGHVHFELGSASIPLIQVETYGENAARRTSGGPSVRPLLPASNPFLSSATDGIDADSTLTTNLMHHRGTRGVSNEVTGTHTEDTNTTANWDAHVGEGVGADLSCEGSAHGGKMESSVQLENDNSEYRSISIAMPEEDEPLPGWFSFVWGPKHLLRQTPVPSRLTDTGAEDDLSDYEEPPEWMEGRREETCELEAVHDCHPFQTFSVLSRNSPGFLLSSFFSTQEASSPRVVGKVKGYIRILQEEATLPFFDLKDFMLPSSFLIRLYVLNVKGLHPHNQDDVNPYLKIKLGKEKLKFRHEAYDDSPDPDFFKTIEIKSPLPGASQLHVEVWDKNRFMPDEICGMTIIDLEDRWFSKAWQNLGKSDDPCRKPIELRTLWRATSVGPQGVMRLWLDIIPQSHVTRSPAWDISLPLPQKLEIRLIVWKARGVIDYDGTDLPNADLYLKCWMETQPKSVHRSDTHWRAKNGNASFNWRFKYNVDVPLSSTAEGQGCLHLQLWDRNMRSNECLCDHVLNLEGYIRLAHRKLTLVDVYGKVRMPLAQDGNGSMESTIVKQKSREASLESEVAPGKKRTGLGSVQNKVQKGRKAVKMRLQTLRNTIHKNSAAQEDADVSDPASTTEYTTFLDAKKKGSAKTKVQRQKDASEDAKSFITQIRSKLGVPEEPDNATWLKCTRLNHDTGKYERTGMLLVSAEIVPPLVAELRKNGLGRSRPNDFPELPPPEGRLKLRALLNPLTLASELCGPTTAACLGCICCCVLFALLVWQLAPVAASVISFASIFPSPVDIYLPVAIFGSALVCCCTCCIYCCIKLKSL
jgi:hypothetical protein